MKLFILSLAIMGVYCAAAQRGKAPVMAPILIKGYYISLRNDTVRGKVQVNPPDLTDFYSSFLFKKQRTNKPKPMSARAVKAYGFDNRNFELIVYNGEKVFAERLAHGRLDLYEYRFNTKKDGNAAVQSYYFIRDNNADESEADLRELKEISGKFYKKRLKPYMKDQPILWEKLDKYEFNRQEIIDAVKEFNSLYSASASR
jgi:hypothetical protein